MANTSSIGNSRFHEDLSLNSVEKNISQTKEKPRQIFSGGGKLAGILSKIKTKVFSNKFSSNQLGQRNTLTATKNKSLMTSEAFEKILSNHRNTSKTLGLTNQGQKFKFKNKTSQDQDKTIDEIVNIYSSLKPAGIQALKEGLGHAERLDARKIEEIIKQAKTHGYLPSQDNSGNNSESRTLRSKKDSKGKKWVVASPSNQEIQKITAGNLEKSGHSSNQTKGYSQSETPGAHGPQTSHSPSNVTVHRKFSEDNLRRLGRNESLQWKNQTRIKEWSVDVSESLERSRSNLRPAELSQAEQWLLTQQAGTSNSTTPQKRVVYGRNLKDKEVAEGSLTRQNKKEAPNEQVLIKNQDAYDRSLLEFQLSVKLGPSLGNTKDKEVAKTARRGY